MSPSVVQFLHRHRSFLSGLAILAACSLHVLPWNPTLPVNKLDSSWGFAINEAVARGMVFGRDIIFAYGPYASVATGQYSPATHVLMMLGSLLIAGALAAGIIVVAGGRRITSALFIALVLLPLLTERDALFLTLPILLVLFAAKLWLPPGSVERPECSPQNLIAVGILVIAMGLLPLIKGTFAISASSMAAVAALLVLRRSVALAAVILLLYAGAVVLLWLVVGQPLWGLKGYFTSLGAIVSGYTGAMAVDGRGSDILYYLVAAAMLLGAAAIAGLRGAPSPVRLTVAAASAAILFLAFKAGFVRHDGHAQISADALLLMGFFWLLQLDRRTGTAVMLVVLVAWIVIDRHYTGSRWYQLPARVAQYYVETGSAFGRWLSRADSIDAAYDRALADIRDEKPLQPVDGTVDIYAWDQAVVLAHHWDWDPRPVMQSYSAYSPALAHINARHLAGSEAPQTVLFAMQRIDGRLPALADGLSWLEIYRRYDFVGFDSGYARFRRAACRAPEPAPIGWLSQGTYRMGQQVVLPDSGSEPLWAEVQVRPTALGQLVALLFKPPPLFMVLQLANGKNVIHRYVASMGAAGFVLSPLVESTDQFVALGISGRRSMLQPNVVKGFVIAASSGIGQIWQPEFTVRIGTIPFGQREIGSTPDGVPLSTPCPSAN